MAAALRSEISLGRLCSRRTGFTFVKLQEARIKADYVPEPFAHSRQAVEEIVGEARKAVKNIQALPSATKLRLAVQLIAKVR